MNDQSVDRWELLQDLFNSARRCTPEQRGTFLERSCRGDARLRAEVEQLLAADEEPEGALDRSPASGSGSNPTEPPGDVELPARVGRYEIVRVIATGGMGTVYEALQENPRRTVAVKVLRSSLASAESRRRFRYESELLARLQHPGIAQVFEAGTHADSTVRVPYFAMEYIPDARPITDYADQQQLAPHERLELFAEVCEAVHHGHQQGVIHRDLKPSNILVGTDGRPRVIDFGVARAAKTDGSERTLNTSTGQLIGTLQYMSPEQCSADPNDVDTRSDVYSLGVVLHELLSGKLPYDVTRMTLHEATRVIREQTPARLSSLDLRLRGEIETIVAKALEKEKDRRYRSAAELADDIRRYLAGEAILARPPSAIYQLRVFARRNKALVGGAAATIVALLLGIVGTTAGLLQANRQRAQTEVTLVQAEDARREAEAVTTFLTDTLSAVDPEQDRGPDVTVRQMLDEAAARIDNEFRDEPLVEAAVRATMARTYSNLPNSHDEAERHAREALAIRHRILGGEHVKVAQSLDDLAWAIRWNGTDEAGQLLTEAIAMRQRLLGENHPDTLRSVYRLAYWHIDPNCRHELAEQLFRQALPGQRANIAIYDNDVVHDDLAMTLAGLAMTIDWFGGKKRNAEAESLYREALATRRQRWDPDHPKMTRTLLDLGNFLTDLGEYEEAARLLRDCVEISRRKYGDDAYLLNCAISGLGRCLLRQGELHEAEKLLRESVDTYRDFTGGPRPDPQLDLGQCLIEMRRFAEAEQILLAAYERRQDYSPGFSRGWTALLLDATVQLYEAWGKPDEAEQWRQKRIALPALSENKIAK